MTGFSSYGDSMIPVPRVEALSVRAIDVFPFLFAWLDSSMALLQSRLFKQAGSNYSTTEKEGLALKVALVKFQPILEGEYLMAITDHCALTCSTIYQNHSQAIAISF